jgi:hypothetical protein
MFTKFISYIADLLSRTALNAVAELKKEHEAVVATHSAALSELKKEHAAALAALKTEHAAALDDAKASFAEEIVRVREQSRKDVQHLEAEIEHILVSKRDAPGARSVRPVKH